MASLSVVLDRLPWCQCRLNKRSGQPTESGLPRKKQALMAISLSRRGAVYGGILEDKG